MTPRQRSVKTKEVKGNYGKSFLVHSELHTKGASILRPQTRVSLQRNKTPFQNKKIETIIFTKKDRKQKKTVLEGEREPPSSTISLSLKK